MSSANPGRELLVLGVLRRRPMSAYDLERTVRSHTGMYREFRRGNLYQFVGRLTALGLLAASPRQAKRGPQETSDLYALTTTGEARFQELLGSVVTDAQVEGATLETAFVLLGQLSRNGAIALLHDRLRNLEDAHARAHKMFDPATRSGSGQIAAEHALARLKSEIQFARETLRKLRDPHWTPEWERDDGGIEDPARRL